MKEPTKGQIKVSNHRCLGDFHWTDYGYEFDCEYETDISCDDCVFVVGYYAKDYRKGKRPWAIYKVI